MTTVIGARLSGASKVYYFSPGELQLEAGDAVIVDTARGLEYGEVVFGNRAVADQTVVPPLKPVMRKATPDDIRRRDENGAKKQDAIAVCRQKIAAHGLEMKVIGADYAFDGSKVIFYFTADGRVDFRELVRDLAGALHMRIELRQVGVRDEAKMLGGLGICGQSFCCAQFLSDFAPVSIKMAKEQNLSLNPVKISGTCGRLMCCLKYEQEGYEALGRITPRAGSVVDTPQGKGMVIDANLFTGQLKVRLDDAPDTLALLQRDTVKVLSLPHVNRKGAKEKLEKSPPA